MKSRHFLEIALLIIVAGVTTLYMQIGQYRMSMLSLYFLPIILSGYFLGRTAAGVLALLCALSVGAVSAALPLEALAAYDSALLQGVAITLWAAVLGLAAIMVGTLCDERARTLRDLQRAYVGVAEVLAQYLQGNRPHEKSRAQRVADLSAAIGAQLGLSARAIDDIRVAALLHDLGNYEVTTNVITRAVGALGSQDASARSHFMGSELMHSLGNVLEGALPLLGGPAPEGAAPAVPVVPLGARVIEVAREYDLLVGRHTPADALAQVRTRFTPEYDPVVQALAHGVQRSPRRPAAAGELSAVS